MELKWPGNQDMFWNQNLQDLSLKGSNPNENSLEIVTSGRALKRTVTSATRDFRTESLHDSLIEKEREWLV